MYSSPHILTFKSNQSLREPTFSEVYTLAYKLTHMTNTNTVFTQGQRVKRIRPQTVYVELSPTGHCPHHEAPHVVNRLLPAWWRAVASSQTLTSASTLTSSAAPEHLEAALRALEGAYGEDVAPTADNHSRGLARVEVRVVDGSSRNWIEQFAAFIHLNQLAIE